MLSNNQTSVSCDCDYHEKVPCGRVSPTTLYTDESTKLGGLQNFYVDTSPARYWTGGGRGDLLPPSSVAVFAGLTTDTSECSEVVDRRPGEPCSSKKVVAAIQQFVETSPGVGKETPSDAKTILPTAPTPEAKAVRDAAQILNCNSESCVVSHPNFQKYVRRIAPQPLLRLELERRFKTKGPRNSTQLLSNFNIDGVLQEWAAVFSRFYNFDFNMIDFERTGGSLARVDVARVLEGSVPQNLGKLGGIVSRPCDTFACVLNTDVSTGRGKHWVAVFGDCRGRQAWSVEYFNSAGNPPPAPIVRWQETTVSRLAELRSLHFDKYGTGPVRTVTHSDVRHQDSQTECGLYALYYIRCRLEGKHLPKRLIPDAAMVEFRKHVFRA